MSISPETRTSVSIPTPRTPAEDGVLPAAPPPAGPARVGADVCTCGHDRDAHEHYRAGSDCGACGADCRAFRSSAAPKARRRPRLFDRRR
ncbi:hypothetical protein WIS52_00750 [Pseudonocardia nematodicida]|uniref:Uncharacterized protein n=1 Tax=Pseudonocardia nematodicida TaxID=1206997 RepID=A0ABV1K3E5_9PSEU